MKVEIKKFIAVKLLSWSFAIMPDCKFKIELSKLIIKEVTNGYDDSKIKI